MAAQTDPQFWRTRSVEDFLKTVYLLQREGQPVATNQLARALHIAPASATDMIKRLADIVEADDVIHRPSRNRWSNISVITVCGSAQQASKWR